MYANQCNMISMAESTGLGGHHDVGDKAVRKKLKSKS